jgi:3-methylcrotonyl-CoA carboxylase alpha subunit
MRHGDDTCDVRGARHDGEILSARFDGDALRLAVRADATRVLLHDADGQRHHLGRAAAYAWESSDAAGGNQLVAPMPGRIVLVKAAAGDEVAEGQELVVMEAMKMELALKAPRAGTIESISAAQGDFVEADAVLVRFAD